MSSLKNIRVEHANTLFWRAGKNYTEIKDFRRVSVGHRFGNNFCRAHRCGREGSLPGIVLPKAEKSLGELEKKKGFRVDLSS